MSAAEGRVGRSILRILVLCGALVLTALVFVAAERARPGATAIGAALGIVPTDPRLVAISDAIALAHHLPNADDLAFAKSAAAAAPLDALPYYITAAARASAAPAESRALAAMALQRDPRLRPALALVVADRARAGDVAGITRAMIRIGVLSPLDSQIWPAIAQLSVDPAARAVIKDEIRRGAWWRDSYLTVLSQSPVDRSIVFEMLQSVGRHGPIQAVVAPGAPDDRRAFLAALVAKHDYERAYLAWVQWLPAKSQAAADLVFDGAFQALPALPPFAWQFNDVAGGAVVIDPAAGLSVDYAGTDGAILAQQTILLPPGRHRLTTQANFAPVSNDSGAAPVVWSLTCLPSGAALSELALPLEGSARRVAGAPFDLSAGCAAQTLTLKVNPLDFSKRLAGRIRSVSIEAVK